MRTPFVLGFLAGLALSAAWLDGARLGAPPSLAPVHDLDHDDGARASIREAGSTSRGASRTA